MPRPEALVKSGRADLAYKAPRLNKAWTFRDCRTRLVAWDGPLGSSSQFWLLPRFVTFQVCKRDARCDSS